jgi:hypothetical protein
MPVNYTVIPLLEVEYRLEKLPVSSKLLVIFFEAGKPKGKTKRGDRDSWRLFGLSGQTT